MTPYQECPRYDSCSCNVCPLDPEAAARIALPGEEACRAQRTTREAIAARYPALIPMRGLLPREIRRDARKAAWNDLPENHPRKVALAAARARSPLATVKNEGSDASPRVPGVASA